MPVHWARNGIHPDEELGGFRSGHCGNSWCQLRLVECHLAPFGVMAARDSYHIEERDELCYKHRRPCQISSFPQMVLLPISWPYPFKTPQMQQVDWFRQEQRVPLGLVSLTCSAVGL